jgi:hypothetical protein
MASAYTPGLTVSADVIVEKIRRLPIKGEVIVQAGQRVSPQDVVARAFLPGPLQTIKLAEDLGLEPGDALALFTKKEGDSVEAGEAVAISKGFFGLFKSTAISRYSGVVESMNRANGHVYVREAAIPIEMNAYIQGEISGIIPEEGVKIRTRGAMVQGIFGVGGERQGRIRMAVSGPGEMLDAEHIQSGDAGAILIGGSGVTPAALVKAGQTGLAGIVVGAVKDVDLMELLGYDIGVAITGQEEISFTLIATEGFGRLEMARRTFSLFQSLEGREASINGATQIRAGVIRPEVIAPDSELQGATDQASSGGALAIGAPIRIIREPYFGALGAVTGLPAQLQHVESGAEVRVLQAKLEDGREVLVPRANVEIIAG